MRWLFLPLLTAVALGQQQTFDTRFTGQTLRFDYYHSGTAAEEHISLDQLRLEGPWPGSRNHLLDQTGLGKYLFEVADSMSGELLYSRGFASIYGEWETTGKARVGAWRTYHESQRFPEPRKAVRLSLKKRGEDGAFHEIYSTALNPRSRLVNRARASVQGRVWALFESGPPAEKVDLLILGDGYTRRERNRFHHDVKRLTDVLFRTEPFRSRKMDFNVRAIDLVSPHSGISNPRAGIWNDTPLKLSYNALDSDRYVLTSANRALREIAALAPYDAIILLANNRKYGGGGIFNLYASVATGTEQAAYIFVHEFGHSFAGLGDEYYASPVAYVDFNPPGVEPWEPNITALLDPLILKWRYLVEPDTPIPTPWSQRAYDEASYAYQQKRQELREQGASEEDVEALFREVKQTTAPLFVKEQYFGQVGAFEGAGYQARGLYRPEVDCIMFTRNPNYFCRVCAEAIERVIGLYAE